MSQNYEQGKSKDVVIADFRKQLQFFVDEGCKIDLIVCEVCHVLISTYNALFHVTICFSGSQYFPCVEEIEMAIEAAKETALKLDIPVAATMCIGPEADNHGVPTGECAVRMCKAGADIVGVNCKFGPNVALDAMRKMKKALEGANLSPFLMCQPLAFYTPEVRGKDGYLHLPETFLGNNSIRNLFSVTRTCREGCLFSAGAAHDDAFRDAEVRAGGVRTGRALHRRLLRLRTSPHSCHERGAEG